MGLWSAIEYIFRDTDVDVYGLPMWQWQFILSTALAFGLYMYSQGM